MPPSDTRDVLLETALDLIWRRNYDSVGVNDICKQAGVTKGSFYHHFESKVELFCAASDYYWEHIKKDLDALLSPMHNPLQQLANWIEFIFSNKVGTNPQDIPGCAFFSAGMQIGCNNAQITESLQAMYARGAKYNMALIQGLANGGYLVENIDIESTTRRMQQYVQGALTYARVTQNIDNLRKDLPEGIFRLIGLKPEFWTMK